MNEERERGTRAAEIAFAIALLLPLGARALAVAVPGAWLWGLDALRYLPAWAWSAWLFATGAVFFAWTRRSRAVRGSNSPSLGIGLAIVTALAVLLLPDRVQFVGDFLLRQGTAEEALPPASLFPQALPLDIALHVAFPTWTESVLRVPAPVASRMLDAAEAGALAWLAFAFARRAGLAGWPALAVATLVAWGGWLALFTGYSKAFTELSVLVVAAAVSGVDALRGRRSGFFLLCATGALGFLLHRSAVGFLPALAFVAWAQARPAAPEASSKPKRPKKEKKPLVPEWLPLLLPLITVAIALPKMLRSATHLDSAHFAAKGEGISSVIHHAVSGERLLDLANLLLFLVPLATLLLIPVPRGRSAPWSRREWIYLLVLGAPFWLIALVLRPTQGLPRDFDVFAPAGVALALVVAARVAAAWRAAPALARFAGATAAAASAPVLLFLLLHASFERGLARVNALADGPPLRGESERALWREYLGARLHRARRYQEAARQFARAAELAPSPNILAAWSVASRRAGDLASEERAFTLLLERAPEDRVAMRSAALTGLARIALERADTSKARDLAARALALDPQSDDARALIRHMAGP